MGSSDCGAGLTVGGGEDSCGVGGVGVRAIVRLACGICDDGGGVIDDGGGDGEVDLSHVRDCAAGSFDCCDAAWRGNGIDAGMSVAGASFERASSGSGSGSGIVAPVAKWHDKKRVMDAVERWMQPRCGQWGGWDEWCRCPSSPRKRKLASWQAGKPASRQASLVEDPRMCTGTLPRGPTIEQHVEGDRLIRYKAAPIDAT